MSRFALFVCAAALLAPLGACIGADPPRDESFIPVQSSQPELPQRGVKGKLLARVFFIPPGTLRLRYLAEMGPEKARFYTNAMNTKPKRSTGGIAGVQALSPSNPEPVAR
jgi:hypothetical protein